MVVALHACMEAGNSDAGKWRAIPSVPEEALRIPFFFPIFLSTCSTAAEMLGQAAYAAQVQDMLRGSLAVLGLSFTWPSMAQLHQSCFGG